jgi:hypothetical protein
MLTTKATIAASRITGSANMKTGIVPEVRVTNAEQRITREIPDTRISNPVWILGLFRAII